MSLLDRRAVRQSATVGLPGDVWVVMQEMIRQYYADLGDIEWRRLTRPEGIIEFAVTTHALQKHLPHSGRVLDLGGGPGRYTIWLAKRGYQVVLGDLSSDLLNIARARIMEAGVRAQVEDVVVCDACDLSRFWDETFDAVLCLGPFYHLARHGDHRQYGE